MVWHASLWTVRGGMSTKTVHCVQVIPLVFLGTPRLNAKALCDVVAFRSIAGCWNPGSWFGALPNLESSYWIMTRLVIKIAVLSGCLLS